MAFKFLQTKQGKGRAWRVARAACVLLAVWSLIAWGAARALVVRAELPHADALAVLAGSGAYVERTHRAAELYAEGRAPKILLTNDNLRGPWSTREQRNPLFVELAVDELRRAGVPAEKIEILSQPVASTHDEALLLREYAVANNLRSVLVVTSPYHTRRALWTMRRVFRDSETEVGIDAPPTGAQSPAPALWWLRPNGWFFVGFEYPKFAYYWLQYR